MTIVKLRNVDRFRDRHGKWRYYFRRGHGKRIPLPGRPGSIVFMLAYQRALARNETGEPIPIARGTRTFDDLARQYFQSPSYLLLSPTSQASYRYIIERCIREENIGHRKVDEISREHIERMLAKRIETPGAAYALAQKVRILLRYAISLGWRRDDPTLGIKRVRLGSIHSWTDQEIAAFEAKWPWGTLERTAFSLLLCTGQRVSDVIRMAWHDIGQDGISVVQQKTKAKLVIPLHPDLKEALDYWPRSHVTILTSRSGRPFGSSSQFSIQMRTAINRAGLGERCVPHGLRKAAARRLAEAGCSVHEIQAITGHASLSEIERYTKAAEQKALASSALARLTKHIRNKNSQTRE